MKGSRFLQPKFSQTCRIANTSNLLAWLSQPIFQSQLSNINGSTTYTLSIFHLSQPCITKTLLKYQWVNHLPTIHIPSQSAPVFEITSQISMGQSLIGYPYSISVSPIFRNHLSNINRSTTYTLSIFHLSQPYIPKSPLKY
jgi:hypothetical protein